MATTGDDALPIPRWRQELPFLLLGACALAAPAAVLDQGGDWRGAVLAGCAVLGAPGAAVLSVLAVARLAVRLRGSRGADHPGGPSSA